MAATLLLLADADWVDDLVVVPGADSVLVHAKRGTSATEEIGQVFLFDNREEIVLIGATLYSDLGACLLVQETLDDGPDTTEKHRCIHDKGLSHDLWVVVRADLGGELNQSVHLL